jgi:type IV pilus assembly protein PilB
MQNSTPLMAIFKNLLKDNQITKKEYEEIVTNISNSQDIIEYIIEHEVLSSDDIVKQISQTFNKNIIDLSVYKKDNLLVDLIPEKLIRKHKIMPLIIENGKLKIATYNPFNDLAKSEVKLHLSDQHYVIVFELAPYKELNSLIDELYDENMEYGSLSDEDLAELEFESPEKESENIGESAANDAPIVKLSNKILIDSINLDASDIHIEPYEHNYRIRYRVDGVLSTRMEPKKSLEPKLSARFKIMCGADISEKRKPQDGRIKLKISKTKSIDFRVNILPTLFGEKIVLRKLDATSAQMGIEHLGYEIEQKNMFMEALHKPQGMILVTGPTGSGKTVSLYTGLNIINTEEINISTAEDPVEINLDGVNQVNVNPKQGLTFAEALRSFLRQDPDVIMIGEIRDLETASIGVKAAQTGHMVMSTLHTNSAAETITRLINMGVPAFNVATVVNLIIAQRLARRLCKHCKVKQDIPEKILIEEGFSEKQIATGFQVYNCNHDGCDECNKGYKGRVGIYEVVRVTKKISEAIMNGATSIELADIQVEEGFNTLRLSSIEKVISGVTTLEEINRVTQE